MDEAVEHNRILSRRMMKLPVAADRSPSSRRASYLLRAAVVVVVASVLGLGCDDSSGANDPDVEIVGQDPDSSDSDTSAETNTPADTLTDPQDGVDSKDLTPEWSPPEPSLFDCTSLENALPGRLSPVPLGCITDPSCHETMIVGHRSFGSGSTAPENSRAGLRAAIRLGLDGVELDVRDTLDGQLVLMHDGSVDRTTNGSGEVSALTFEEVTALVLDLDLADGDFGCETVPSLAEAFELARDRLFIHIDCKTGRADLVAQAISDAGMLDQVIISTPDFARAHLARRTVPEVMVQVRPDTAEAVETVFVEFSADLPELFEIDDPLLPAVEARIHAGGRKALVNAWGADIRAVINDDFAGYSEIVDRGADLLQCEYPLFGLRALGRIP